MSFVRAEALRALHRWREMLAGAALTALGCWWIFGTGGLLFWLGLVLLQAGLALAGLGLQRARLRTGAVGPGIVQIDEGRVIYFGPLTGGAADLATLTRLDIDPTGHPAHWVLDRPGEAPLFIPVNATGGEQLLDAFAMLPGFQTARAVDMMTHPPAAQSVLWHRRTTSDRLGRNDTPPAA